jgi:hypothetical protein
MTEWMVMDARAIDDPDDAVVLENCGQSRPEMRVIKQDWGGMGACLCKQEPGRFIEFVEVIE